MRILIDVDDSPQMEEMLRLSAQLARRATEPPTLLIVIKHAADRPRADIVLGRARELLQPEAPQVQTKVRLGNPANEIILEAEAGSYDLLILAERARHNLLMSLHPNSTAERVVKAAPCPVIVAKGKAKPIRRILLCDSGAESPSTGLRTGPSTGLRTDPSTGFPPTGPGTGGAGPSGLNRLAVQLAGLLGGEEEITVLHVMSQMSAGPGVKGKQLRASVEQLIEDHTPEGELLEHDTRALQRPGIHPHPKVRHGLVLDEILAEAHDGDYDLVIIGAHRGKGWQHILFDDLAHKIVMRLDRPVLVVR
jgi:nucleotide-binding universal stress UspA family protein